MRASSRLDIPATSRFDASNQWLSLLTTLDIQRELADLRQNIRQDIREELREFSESQGFCANSEGGSTTLRNVAADIVSPAPYVSTNGHDAMKTFTIAAPCDAQVETGSRALDVPRPCDHAPHALNVPGPCGDAPSLDDYEEPTSALGVLRNSFLALPGQIVSEDAEHGDNTDGDSTMSRLKMDRWKAFVLGLLKGRSVVHELWDAATAQGFEKVIPRVRPSGFQYMSTAISKSWSRLDEPEEYSAWWVVDPFSTRRVAWDFIGILLCMYDLIMVPVLTAFTMSPSYESFATGRETFGACFWTLDMLVSFATGTLDKDGLVEFRPQKIARKYLTTWFVFDLIIVTMDWSILLVNALSSSGSMRVSKAITRILRASRLLRILKIREKAQEVLGAVESESLFTVLKVLKFIAILFIICHYFACAWYIIGDIQDDSKSWVRMFLDDSDSTGYSYAVALHFSLTQFTFGNANITPQTASELCFVSSVLVIALLVFSLFISTMSRVVAHLEEVNANEAAQDVLIRRFCAENGVPRKLMARMRNFKRQRSRSTTRRKVSESDVEIFQALPLDLLQQLREHRFMPHLLVHPVFQQCLSIKQKLLLDLCWSGVEEMFLWPDQDIFPNGKNVNRMIFLESGKLRYHFREGSSVEEAAIILPGQWACEETLWSKTSFLFGPFVAVVASQLLLVIPAKIHEILSRDLICRHFLGTYARLFVRTFNEESCEDSDECVLFNDPSLIDGIVKAAWEQHIKETRSVVLPSNDTD